MDRGDDDESYKLQWRRSDFGAAAIEQNLSRIADRKWVMRECTHRVAKTAEDTSALLSYGLAEAGPDDDHVYVAERLRLLQFKDRLQTFLGIHMGRFSAREYKIFRETSLFKVAIRFAEGGKTGPLELLFKRHLFTLAPDILRILDAIPETLSPHKYEQLLPEPTPPNALLPQRSQDWVENIELVRRLPSVSSSREVSLCGSTEYLVRSFEGLRWPTEGEVTAWYLDRARTIDRLSGQLENSILLLGAGLQKGFSGLSALSNDAQDLFKISFLHMEGEEELTLSRWEGLQSYEKFKLMLKGATEDNIVETLLEVAVPFMRKQASAQGKAFLARFLEELSSAAYFGLAAIVIQDACKEAYRGRLFEDEADLVEAAVSCIYATPQTDQWDLMASILSKLQEKEQVVDDTAADRGLRRGLVSAFRNRTLDSAFPRPPPEARKKHSVSDELEKKIVGAEGHVQAGQILYNYQVPTPTSFFVHQDVNGTKQKIRILLSKLSRRQPRVTEGEWAVLWQDLQVLQEKAFTFLDREYIFYEFCRALLKAGKFSLAKSYFKDPASNILSAEKVENLVLQTAREYFYSASSLESYDIERARECLRLIPFSKSATAEADIMVALTEKLPKLGVNLLPAQFRQIKNPMEVVKMAIYSRKGPVDQLLDVARLLGLSDTGDMAAIEEAVAREAAASGDLELAQELCLGLAKKEYGKVWDLCAAIGRGPSSEKLQAKARAELLAFSLKHCDEESIGELLVAWKEFDLLDQCAEVAASAGLPIVDSTEVESLTASLAREVSSDETSTLVAKLKAGQHALHQVGEDCEDSYGKDKKKVLAFACLQLPWLLKAHLDRSCDATNATELILHGLGVQGIVPNDSLLLRLTKKALLSKEDYHLACGYLANFSDSRRGVEFLNTELEKQNSRDYELRLLKIAVLFSSLQEALPEVHSPEERRELLGSAIRERLSVKGTQEAGFWTKYKEESKEKLRVFEQIKPLTALVPNLQVQRVLSADIEYINDAFGSVLSPLKFSTVPSLEELASMLEVLRAILPGNSDSSLGSLFTLFVKGAVKSFNCEYCEGFSSFPEGSRQVSHLHFMERKYVVCQKYFELVPSSELGNIVRAIFQSSYSLTKAHDDEEHGTIFLSYVLKFWIQVIGDIFSSGDVELFSVLSKLIEERLVNRHQGWNLLSEILVGGPAVPPRVMLRSMILAGCSFEVVGKFVRYLARPSEVSSEGLLEVYLEALDASIERLIASSELQLTKNVICSAGFHDRAGVPEDDSKLMDNIQHAIWSKLCAVEAPSGTRITLLEILGGIGELFGPNERRTELVLLKSAEIISKEFGGDLQITADSLSSSESASSIVTSLEQRTYSQAQAVALITLLREWEQLFEAQVQLEEKSEEEKQVEDEDNWGDGWQQFDVDLTDTPVLHKLHACWKTAFIKLAQFQGLEVVLNVLDGSCSSMLLLNEDEAKQLVEQVDLLSALKLVLLLPYETLRRACLTLLEEHLQRTAEAMDSATLILLLSSGLVPSLAADSGLPSLFATVCTSTGKLAKNSEAGSTLLFPFLVAELTRGGHIGTAGSLVMQHMKVPFSFATWNVSHFALRRYLEAHRGRCKPDKWRESACSNLPEAFKRLVALFETAVTEALISIK